MSSPEVIIMREKVENISRLGIQVGNIVKLRNGDTDKIVSIEIDYGTDYPVITEKSGIYTLEGKALIRHDGREHPTDIVDWNYKDKDNLSTEDTVTNNTTGFIKHDKGKPLVSLIEPDFILGLAKVMTQGAKEYGRDNWKECEEPHRYLDALLRHTLSYWKGDKIDDNSGKSHLLHIAFNAMALHYLDTKLKD